MAGRHATTIKRSTRWAPVPDVRRIPVGQGCGYTMIHRLVRREVRGEVLLLGIAGAYDAFGLIGSEANGLFLLNETRSHVVFDEHGKVGSGYYGAAPSQLREFDFAQALGPDEFLDWARGNARFRGAHTLPEKGGKR